MAIDVYLKPLAGLLTGYLPVCRLLAAMVVSAPLLATPLLSTPVAAQTALRAPLSIVPPPMQAALGATQTRSARSGQDNKLAPRASARQMKRAVRAVAATPGADVDIVQVGQLGALQDAPVGLDAGLDTGLGRAVWQGARLAFITDQMARLTPDMAWPGLYHLERKLHRGAHGAPIGTVDDTSWFGARLTRLLALGDNQSVIDLEALTGAAHSDGYAAQALALAHLGRGDDMAACAVKRPARGQKGARDTSAFFMQMLVYCQLVGGAFEKAGLTLELNQKTLGGDTLFRDIAYLLSARAPLHFGPTQAPDAAKRAGDAAKQAPDAAKQATEQAQLVLPRELTAMQIALLRLAGQPLADDVTHVPAFFMAALASDDTQSAAVQLHAAHRALRYGQISAARFAYVSRQADLSRFAGPLPPASGQSAGPPDDGVFLAQALHAIEATPRAQQPRIVSYFLRRALARNLWTDLIAVLDDRLGAVLPTQAQVQTQSAIGRGEPYDATRAPEQEATPEQEAVPLSDADAAILLVAFWQAGLYAQAENIRATRATGELVARLARWVAPQTALDKFALLPTTPAPPDAGPDAGFDTRLDAGLDADLDADNATGAQTGAIFANGQLPEWGRFMVRRDQAGAAEALYLRRELAIYLALGADVPPILRAELALPDAETDALRLARLAENKWIGDLVLALVGQFADTQAAAFDAAATQSLLANLRRAGLDGEARALATDLLLAHAAALAARAPSAFLAKLRPVIFDTPPFNTVPFAPHRDSVVGAPSVP